MYIPAPVLALVAEGHVKLLMLYWLPKLHKICYKSRFIANSSLGTTTELSICMASCLSAIRTFVIKLHERLHLVNVFWSNNYSDEILDELKSNDLSTYDTSTL